MFFPRCAADDPTPRVRTRAQPWQIVGLSCLHQINLLARPEYDLLAGLEISRYRPQAKSHVKRIDAHCAPERQFTELVLQRVTVAAEGYGYSDPTASFRCRRQIPSEYEPPRRELLYHRLRREAV
jgi:hypothetical protein